MLTILVGKVNPHTVADLCPEDLHLMPADLFNFFKLWFCASIDSTIRVYNNTVINFVGELVERGAIKYTEVRVVTEYGVHSYTEDGVLDSSWPFGLFNYSN